MKKKYYLRQIVFQRGSVGETILEVVYKSLKEIKADNLIFKKYHNAIQIKYFKLTEELK